MTALLVAGCAGIEPYEPRNCRQEELESGLYTGSAGEFVIYRKADGSETDREAGKISDEIADGEPQKKGSEGKKSKIKNGEQQP